MSDKCKIWQLYLDCPTPSSPLVATVWSKDQIIILEPTPWFSFSKCFYTGVTGAMHILNFDTKTSPVETQAADVKVADYQWEDKDSIHSWLIFLICWATEKFGQTILEQSNPTVSRKICLKRLQFLFLRTNHNKQRLVKDCTIYNYVLVLLYTFDNNVAANQRIAMYVWKVLYIPTWGFLLVLTLLVLYYDT